MEGSPRKMKVAPRAQATFDVTCVVGTVVIGGGDDAPEVVAMKIIAEAGPGEYKFPAQDGGTNRIIFEHEPQSPDEVRLDG